jgi:hypothetical protein
MTDLDDKIDREIAQFAAEMVDWPPEKLSGALGDLCVAGINFEATREQRVKKIRTLFYFVLMEVR